MPTVVSYPGVYIEEIPSGVRTLTGVATSITAFVGRALRGPINEPTIIFSYADFERQFGGLWLDSDMSYAVRDFYLNGGGQAVIVRVHKSAVVASASKDGLDYTAANEGKWGNSLTLTIDHTVSDKAVPDTTKFFNLVVTDDSSGSEEVFRNVTVDKDYTNHSGYLPDVLSNRSGLLRASIPAPITGRPPKTDPGAATPVPAIVLSGGTDGDALMDDDGAVVMGLAGSKTGMYALEKADIFNLLCIPNLLDYTDTDCYAEATAYCTKRRAMAIVDPATSWVDHTSVTPPEPSINAAVYFPRLVQPDPLRDGMMIERPPCGAIAGVIARTDAQRGIWKAPAGLEAALRGVPQLSVKLTDNQIGLLNPLGVNCLKSKPPAGRIVWGARTTAGADLLSSEWKYIPVRRLALNIEESLYRGTQWVVFEPNDEPLWAQIRLNVGAFMNGLFRKGAFQGSAPADAYFVKCDSETTPQADINLGIVNIVVGFAPLKPAEFVIIKLQQIAGQLAT